MNLDRSNDQYFLQALCGFACVSLRICKLRGQITWHLPRSSVHLWLAELLCLRDSTDCGQVDAIARNRTKRNHYLRAIFGVDCPGASDLVLVRLGTRIGDDRVAPATSLPSGWCLIKRRGSASKSFVLPAGILVANGTIAGVTNHAAARFPVNKSQPDTAPDFWRGASSVALDVRCKGSPSGDSRRWRAFRDVCSYT
jgi:hypothetical protein